MTPTGFRRAAPPVVLLAGLGLAGCASTPPPPTDAERTAIIDTMTRVSLGLFESRERAACEAAAEQHFSGREPALTWSIVGQGTAGVWTFRTTADLKSACDDTPIPSRFDLEQADGHVLSRDHAYIVLTGLFTREPIGGPPERTRFVMTSVFERVGEDWKIAHNRAAGTIEEP